jgi:hypothetical protein
MWQVYTRPTSASDFLIIEIIVFLTLLVVGRTLFVHNQNGGLNENSNRNSTVRPLNPVSDGNHGGDFSAMQNHKLPFPAATSWTGTIQNVTQVRQGLEFLQLNMHHCKGAAFNIRRTFDFVSMDFAMIQEPWCL